MVKVEQNTTVKFSAKGELVSIDVDGIRVKDLKEGTIDLISFENVRASMIGKEITLTFQNKEEV